ncbi:MOSC domain-containing protein [Pontibacter chitinilyticus]|uniref:MOSC domain-containing protein n=1 Tax=Pontibacter chitinilyticus TaxID=2674989 RepID=UPI003219421D
MEELYLSDIYIYPIKSLGGIRLQEAEVEPQGLRYDRRWMLVDEQGAFLTQRQHAHMALLQVALLPDGLQVTHKQELLAPLFIPFEDNRTGPTIEVQIWDDVVPAQEVNREDAHAWFSEALGMPARLVHMPLSSRRLVDQRYARQNEVVSFADAYPFMLIGQASLDDLNSRLQEPVPMDRFRPTFVFRGGTPFAEDTWQEFRIGTQSFCAVKPCARCVVITINQNTTEKSAEPLRTLATYRLQKNKVMFGQNLLQHGNGAVRIGDKIEVLRWR